ncbi:MAG: flavodoxin [Clostridiales bacterium]|nr:flavodoxin [Clostridiales bacterium]
MLDYQVLYVSKTGNTKRIAKEIFAALPGTSKDICDLQEQGRIQSAEIYFIGFWVNCGTCEKEVMDILSTLHGKKVVLFGTCGMGRNREYDQKIAHSVEAFLPEDCEYLGYFLCQGKMPMDVRRRYEEMLAEGREKDKVKQLIRNFDEALLHPDEGDFAEVREFVKSVLQNRTDHVKEKIKKDHENMKNHIDKNMVSM